MYQKWGAYRWGNELYSLNSVTSGGNLLDVYDFGNWLTSIDTSILEENEAYSGYFTFYGLTADRQNAVYLDSVTGNFITISDNSQFPSNGYDGLPMYDSVTGGYNFLNVDGLLYTAEEYNWIMSDGYILEGGYCVDFASGYNGGSGTPPPGNQFGLMSGYYQFYGNGASGDYGMVYENGPGFSMNYSTDEVYGLSVTGSTGTLNISVPGVSGEIYVRIDPSSQIFMSLSDFNAINGSPSSILDIAIRIADEPGSGGARQYAILKASSSFNLVGDDFNNPNQPETQTDIFLSKVNNIGQSEVATRLSRLNDINNFAKFIEEIKPLNVTYSAPAKSIALEFGRTKGPSPGEFGYFGSLQHSIAKVNEMSKKPESQWEAGRTYDSQFQIYYDISKDESNGKWYYSTWKEGDLANKKIYNLTDLGFGTPSGFANFISEFLF